jgi:Mg/Co/Ni transporter MgtE
MVTPAAGASIDPALALALSREERFADEIYEENPVGVFRGLVFAMVFNLMLALSGAAGWELWRFLR